MDKYFKLPVNVRDVGQVVGFVVMVLAIVAVANRVPVTRKLLG
jgi:hypothetical protein